MDKTLAGTGVALATPLHRDYSVDYDGLKRLIEHTIAGNVDYLVALGTTGESPVFSWEEKLQILDFIIEHSKDKPVVFGLGGNHTHDLIRKSADLKEIPIAAILSVSPYYNRPSQEGMIRHYTMLADEFPKPLILYNVPARTGANVAADTTLKLAEHPNIVAMKEASGDFEQIKAIASHKPDDFLLISGEDSATLGMIKEGAQGVISVIANILPTHFTDMANLALEGRFAEAEMANEQLVPVYNLLSEEGNPSSLKAGLEVMDICSNTVKPPLFEGSASLKEKWKELLAEFSA